MKNNIKICFISGVIARSGGTERVGSIIANALATKGYDVTVLSFWDEGVPFFYINDNVKVEYLLNPKTEGKLYRTYIYPIIKLHSYIMKNNIDVIIDIDTVIACFTSYAIKGTKCKQISWEHFNYWAMIKRNEKNRFRAKKLIKNNASKLVVLTEEDRKKHIKEYKLDPEFVVAMPNPCLSNAISDYKFENKVFLAVGRLSQQKNFSALLNAWSLICNDCSEWKLIIVGKGELENSLRKQAENLKLCNIIFAGHSNDIAKYYRQASCFVLSSEYEGFPMVILEAQSFGLPVISFDCKTGPKDLIQNNKTGFLVEDGNIEALAKKMLEFTQNEKKAVQMSKEAQRDVQKYNLESITSKWCTLIESVVN